jgi:hypothetical protein
MLVSCLNTYLGFGADLLRAEVPTGSKWINRLISPHALPIFTDLLLSKFKSCRFNPPLTGRTIRTFSRILRIPRVSGKISEVSGPGLTAAKKFVIFRFDYSPPSSRHLDPFTFPGRRFIRCPPRHLAVAALLTQLFWRYTLTHHRFIWCWRPHGQTVSVSNLSLSTNVAHLKRFFSTKWSTLARVSLENITLRHMNDPSQDMKHTSNTRRTRARKLNAECKCWK